jgi:hypothetical protein
VYICVTHMKILSLKLDDRIFEDAEAMSDKLKLPRNRYINQAVEMYNQLNKRRLLKSQLEKESELTRKESMRLLSDFEQIMDETKAV